MLWKQPFPLCERWPGASPQPRERKQEGGIPAGSLARGGWGCEPSQDSYLLRHPDPTVRGRRRQWTSCLPHCPEPQYFRDRNRDSPPSPFCSGSRRTKPGELRPTQTQQDGPHVIGRAAHWKKKAGEALPEVGARNPPAGGGADGDRAGLLQGGSLRARTQQKQL